MQLTTPKGNFIEKIIRDNNGRLVRATFCVYENLGRVRAHLLNITYIEEKLSLENKILFLAGKTTKNDFVEKIYLFQKTVSPYFNSDLLFSLGSKPRAPTI